MVTLEQIKAQIKSVRYINGAHINRSMHPCSTPFDDETGQNLSRMTICIIELNNGFIFTGVNIATSREHWDEKLAFQYSYDSAIDKAWEAFGFVDFSKTHPLPTVIGAPQHD